MADGENSFERKRAWLSFLSKNRKETSKKDSPENEPSQETRSCQKCGASYTVKQWSSNQYVCKRCGMHHPIPAYERLHNLLDPHTFLALPEPAVLVDPLLFSEYQEKCEALSVKTGLTDAIVTCTGEIHGEKCVVGVMDNRFLMGSMGTYVGEAVTLAIEYAMNEQLPLIFFCSSGGARMQEGIFSLLQMTKTSAAIEEFSRSGGFYISCLTHPTTGGVTASFASLGDIMLAEPGALIGFAGPRVIEETIRKKLPEGFQKSEYLETHGFLDQVVERKDFPEILAQLLKFHKKGDNGFASSRLGNTN